MNQNKQLAEWDPCAGLMEMRTTQRVAIDLPVDLYAAEFAGGLSARSRDLSASGICIATACPFDLKSIHALSVCLADGTIKLDADGMWQRDDARQGLILSGFTFSNLSIQQSRMLQDLVFERGRRLAQYLHEQTVIGASGLEDAIGIASASRIRLIKAGQLVYRQGDNEPASGSIFVIMQGCVTLQIRIKDAIDAPFIQLEEGEILGGLPVLTGLENTESAAASQDLELLEIDQKALRHLRLSRPLLAHRLTIAVVRAHVQRMSRALECAAQCF